MPLLLQRLTRVRAETVKVTLGPPIVYTNRIYEAAMAKTPISIRLEADLLQWFKKAAPDGYQTMIQTVLQDYRKAKEQRELVMLGRAQQIFVQYHSRCFWHLRSDLKITAENVDVILAGLRKYGGLDGLRLASQLESD